MSLFFYRDAGDLWAAIDRLAAGQGVSASGLARLAGLDPTVLNPSKRRRADGRFRWPGMETVARLLDAASTSPAEFFSVKTTADISVRIPRADWSALRGHASFDRAGLPSGADWHLASAAPFSPEPHDYLICLDTSDFEPVLRDGSTLLLSPAGPVLPGDRCIFISRDGVLPGILDEAGTLRVLNGQDIPPDQPQQNRFLHRILAVTL
ncbi:helix-turn-helix transcriptional regulator [Acetobacter sp. AN02]|uniref:helix-turn-helix transcriptional regulator n=1 Tax=Acetobacter sp. AN02 TaxID=2894186 RepID=UPI0024345D95|nr:helix-turn-helix transcriptional regulator [Acetobacter sp. AN02]MDG6095040.1 helix-turn-helix transcriptional regulator [Acetobacter sp. AN02]